MSIHLIRRLAIASGVAIALPLSISNATAGFEAGLGATHYSFSENVPVTNGVGGKAILGYRFNNPWALELNYALVPTEVEEGTGEDLDFNHGYIDALYHLETNGNVEPYFAAGAGRANLSFDGSAEDFGDNTVGMGAGVKYYMSDNLMLRPDIHFFKLDDFDHFTTAISLSLSYAFGGRNGSNSQAAVSKPVVEAPVEAPQTSDRDGDGVLDSSDQCPSTPTGVSVNGQGCAVDIDDDGVADYKDECPETSRSFKVDAKGCPVSLIEDVSIELSVKFATNSDVVAAENYSEIRRVADFLTQYPNTSVEIEGHTDTRGNAGYNKRLSQKRADAVAAVLINKMNVDSGRVSAMGYGEERPIADESTPAGLLENRRVIARVSGQAEKVQNR